VSQSFTLLGRMISNARQLVVGRWVFIIVLVGLVLVSAGCGTPPAGEPAQPSPKPPEPAIPHKILPTAGLIAGTAAVSEQAVPNLSRTTQSSACPKLDSRLNQVSAAANPAAMAAALNLRLKDGKVQVRLLLGQADAGFLTSYGVELGSQSGQTIQAFVPLDRLCEIASLAQVVALQIPAQGNMP
jgi:hypothetical protein